ncbi:MAG: S26 family signal peptidase [[Clostridium] scindens]
MSYRQCQRTHRFYGDHCYDRDRIIINRLSYKFDSPKRGDIVSFILPDDGTSQYLKRIIDFPGDP